MLEDLNLLEKPLIEKINRFNVLNCELPEHFTSSVKCIFKDTIEYGRYCSCITSSSGLRIFISNNWFYIAAILAPLYKPLFEYKSLIDEIVPADILKNKNEDIIIQNINNSKFSNEEKELLIKFATDYNWWNGGNGKSGKSLDRGDWHNSAILALAKVVNVSQSYICVLWEFLGQKPDYVKLLDDKINFYIENGDPLKVKETRNTNAGTLLPLQQIFYGAPGTGKSFSIKKVIAEHQGTDSDSINMEADNIFRTTFHPDYDYAQFVGCYKPTKENKKETEKQVILDYSSLVEKFKEYLAVQPINITKACTLFGYDYHDSLVKIQENGHTIAQILEDAYKGGTTYSSQIYAGMTVFETSSSQKQNNSSITYSFVPQVFTNALVKAYESHEPVYLVIEEINRGNCAQIFGDIFQLLDRNSEGESEYAINVDEDLKQYLEEKCPAAITDGKIKLPSNFNIIATMNTSDQSLFPMDSAFKRRWEWEYVPVNYGDDVDSAKFEITIDDKIYNWHTFLKAVNAKIKDVTKSEDKQMGNFFIKGNVDAKAFCNKVMFYLWNDVSKDYYESNDSLFQYIEDDSKPAKHFSFNELFGDGQTELLKGYMKFIGCDPVSDKSEEQKAKEEEESQANE